MIIIITFGNIGVNSCSFDSFSSVSEYTCRGASMADCLEDCGVLKYN